ncbi:MAG: LamG domain-containing protein, partial [Verrucomicrobiota bacterium]|nr:LamG domain-containing protein [Verrucomicrobiota bacterium]
MTKQLKSARRFIAAGVMTAFMFVGVANSNAQNISDGLIAYWPFDADLNDAVGDSHGEAMGGDDIAFTGAQWGKGIELDGVDQFVQTPVDNEEMFDFQDGTGFSISAWYKVGEFTKSWQALIAKGEGNRWRVHRRGGETQLTGNGGNGDVPGGTGDITDGEFHHIVVVSDPDNGEVRLYSDGELVSTGPAPAIQSNENPMMIGENPDARNRTWSGIIDDVGIWNRPLTEDEIAFLGGNSISSALGTQLKVGLNFAVNEGDSSVEAAVAAGLVPQTNWNNLPDGTGSASDIVADDGGASVATSISVEWVSNNSWASTGRGEENNEFEDGGDRLLFTGYLDTGAATTTSVTITGIPQELQDAGYSVVCYLMGGVPEKGGGYWVEDADGNVLTDVLIGDSIENSSEYIEDPGVDHTDFGNYVILKGVSAGSIVVKASTEDGLGWAAAGRGAIRAPLNAIQLVPESSGRRVVGTFTADWAGDVEPEGTFMSGVTAVGDEFLHITDATNGQNGAFTVEDFSDGAVFTDFEMSFRLHMSDSTCCGDGNDTVAGHRPADGMSINIGNDLPDTISLAEEGSGSGIRICFDTWDSGGGEAPAIDVWRGAEGEVGDGDQGGWSGGMVVRQNFNGVTTASEEELFKDENGDYVWMWTQGEWA